MAQGRNAWTRRLLLLAGISLYALLLVGDVVPNPFPGIWEWVSRDRPLAPNLAWQDRFSSRPGTAVVAADTVAVNAGDRAELRERSTGRPVGIGDPPGWPADWVAVAGPEGDETLITSEGPGSGYQVRDPVSGEMLHEDEEAVAVWTYRDARLDLRCDERRACQLRRYGPGGSTPDWTTDLPGRRVGMLGANPELAGARGPDPDRIDGRVAGPVPVPRVLGFPVERRGGDAVAVVDTATGQVLQVPELGENQKIMVVGDRVIRSETARRNGICLSSATGYDAATGAQVWGPEPYHVWSTAACEQRTPPLSAGAAMAVVEPDGTPIVLDAYDGRVLWSGDAEESVVGLSPELAVIRAADQTTRYAVVLGGDGTRLWERTVEPDAEVLIARCGVVVADRDPSRVYVWEPRSGELLVSVSTNATVMACASDGVVLAGGRSVGFARFDGAVPGGDPDAPLDSK